MCQICLDIDKGRIRQLTDLSNEEFFNMDYIHFSEIVDRLNKANKQEVLRRECTCGARYTSRPDYHLKYCEEPKK